MPARLAAAAFCFMALLSAMTFAAAPVVEPTGMWSGKVNHESLRKLAPQYGFIADAETWKKLWTAWRPSEELPTVDFAEELILVGTVPGPNLVIMRPTVDDNGDVKFIVSGTKIGGEGFGYKLTKIGRHGVRTVKGSLIEPAFTSGQGSPVGVWDLKGDDAGPNKWIGTFVLRELSYGKLTGYVDWIADDGNCGREHLTAEYDNDSRQLTFVGAKLQFPNRIVRGKYVATLSADGSKLRHGKWGSGEDTAIPRKWSAKRVKLQ